MKLIKIWEADIQKAFCLQNSFEEDENGFCNSAYGFTFEEFEKYVADKKDSSLGIGLKEGYVPDTTYILEDNDNYVGIFNFRHHLNEGLKGSAGHIGYGIAKEYRGKGYASKGLEMLISLAKKVVPEDEIYMSVHKDNPSSLQVQLKNGAYIHHENENKYFTRIKK